MTLQDSKFEFDSKEQVWLDASLPEDAVPEDPCQLPFPPQMQAIDLGPAINDALQMALPSTNVCGQPDCSVECKLQFMATYASTMEVKLGWLALAEAI